jgi:ribosomal protein S18 acetylase RimI-like enzyme
MDESRYRIRSFRDDDYATASRVDSRLNPDFPVTPDEIRQWNRLFQEPNLVKLDFIVEDRSCGAGVAYGSLHHDPEMYHPHRFWAEVDVDPDHQHRGIGRALYEHLEGLARTRSVETLWASVRADDVRSVRFFERAGFAERRRSWMSRLSLEATPTEMVGVGHKSALSGVTFTTLAEEGADRRDVQERIYRLDLEASRDAPRMGKMTDISFEQYAELAFRGPRYYPEAVFLARVGNEYVSMSTLHHLPAEPDTLIVGFTGTLPSYRRLGLASELKRKAVEFARAHGYQYLRTFNDSENPRIWAINQKLGFQVQRVWVRGEKGFGP